MYFDDGQRAVFYRISKRVPEPGEARRVDDDSRYVFVRYVDFFYEVTFVI